MKSKETLRKEVTDFVYSRMNCSRTDWSNELVAWNDCFEKMAQLKSKFSEEDQEKWQDKAELKRWHDVFPTGKALVEAWDGVWSRLAAEGVHGRSVYDAVKKSHPADYKLQFEKVKKANLLTYTALIEKALALGAYHPNNSPESLGKWVSSGWLTVLDKQLTIWGGSWNDKVMVNNQEKRRVLSSFDEELKKAPTLAMFFVAQMRKEEKTKLAIQFAQKHALPEHPLVWTAWMLPMGQGRNQPERKSMVKDRGLWVEYLAKVQTVESWQRAESHLVKLVVNHHLPLPLKAWKHTVEHQGLKNLVAQKVGPTEKEVLAL